MCAGERSQFTYSEGNTMSDNLKQKATAVLKSIETGDSEAAAAINAEKYTQHNLGVGDGIAGFGEALAQLPEGSARVNTVRVIQDGNFVVAHTDYDFFGPKVGFDIFLFEDGLIVEHWDNLIETAEPNPSGRTQVDGPTEIEDLELTDANKALALTFVETVLVNGETSNITDFVNPEHYHQHNPAVADGLDGLGVALEAFAEAGIVMAYDTIHAVLGEGNFVLAVSEGTFGGEPTSYYDLFRMADGRIVEHWDVIEPIADESTWAHQNGKFGNLASLGGRS